VKKSLTLSIIIPVYNEEHHIRGCLESIKKQTVKPDEVIVVDNNCTDDTIRIAKQFSFVQVIKEPKQGLIPARNRGLDTAKSDILGRIDADVRLFPDWVEKVKKSFDDPSVMAATGVAVTNILPKPFTWPHGTLWTRLYFMWRESAHGIRLIWGANMALRQSVWQKIKADAQKDDSLVHEDQDLSYLLAGEGFKVAWNDHMRVSTGGQQYHEWAKLYEYFSRDIKTKKLHRARGTLNNPESLRINLFQRAWRRIVTLLPEAFFWITSFLGLLVASCLKRIRHKH